MQQNWHSLSLEAVFEQLKSAPKGLSSNEAKKRLAKYGPNELAKKKKGKLLKIFLSQFKSFFVVFLVVAGLVSFLVKEYADAIIIFAAVFLNVIFGFLQESKVEKILSVLKKQLAQKVHVLRDGQEKVILAKFLVPGDIIFLSQGDKVAADIRLIRVSNLEINEAPLTGESMPSSKQAAKIAKGAILAERENMAYLGTLVTRGEAQGIVVATGKQTQLGKISHQLRAQPEGLTPLQKKINRLAKFIASFVMVAFVIILIDGIWARPGDITEIFITAVAVAVSAIPEGLLIAVTVVLAIGARQLSRKKAYLRKLVAAETLGGVTVILTDKTGTLTEGRMSVDKVLCKLSPKNQYLINEALIFANSARIQNPNANYADWHYLGSPTETALLRKALSSPEKQKYFKRDQLTLDYIPFDSRLRYQARLIKEDNSHFVYCTGAPEKILQLCVYQQTSAGKEKISAAKKKLLTKQYKDFASKGLRILGAAYQEVPLSMKSFSKFKFKDFVFLGFVVLRDPLRKNVKKTFGLTKQAGIRTVIVTGDHALTAQAIARDLGLKVSRENIVAGDEIVKLSNQELEARLNSVLIFARVSPYDKIRILEAYQRKGEVVAMTGDGINDALALKAADIGIAVGSGQEVAREAADLVLLQNNFSNIVEAVRLGRVILDNIKKIITYLLSDTFSEILLVAGSLIAGLPLPILPAQILWINLLGDGLPSFALAFEPGEKDIMKRKPYAAKIPLVDKEMKVIIFVIGLIVDILLFGLFLYLMSQGRDIAYVRTMMFVGLSIDTFFIALVIKSLKRPLFKINLLNNLYLLGALLVSLTMLLAVLYVPFLGDIFKLRPLILSDWLIIISLGAIKLVGIEIVKWLYGRRQD